MVYDAKRAFLHFDAVTGTYVKPPQQRDTERCWLLKKCMYGTVPAAAGWQHLGQKVGADIGLLSRSSLHPARMKSSPCTTMSKSQVTCPNAHGQLLELSTSLKLSERAESEIET